MAKKKINQAIDTFEINVSSKEEIIKDTVIVKAIDTDREMILDLREKGFDNNRIAARLMIQKSIVENTK
tara:strand:+ start:757 stop:963 length:207 start_codon:yes stop_codon:yes gene_type:complete